jgi:hypothetical protein
MRLSVVAPWVRKAINFLIIFVILYYVGVLAVFPAAKTFFATVFPSHDAPDASFGKLDQLKFVTKAITNSQVSYILNTTDGKLPSLPTQATVFRFKQPAFSYGSGPKSQKDALTLGFTDADLVGDLKGQVYKWRNSVSGGVLEINALDRSLVLNTPMQNKSGYFASRGITPNYALVQSMSLFSQLERFKEASYTNGTNSVVLGRFEDGVIVETTDPRQAQIARVDLFKKVLNAPVLGPDPDKGLLHVYLRINSPEEPAFNYPMVEAYYHEVETTPTATYPLVPLNRAWKEVQEGKAPIVSVVPKDSNPFTRYSPVQVDRVLINEIYLAYYETPEVQPYLQPIYVFEGNYTSAGNQSGSVTLYYPAVSGEYIKEATPTQTNSESK